MGRQLHMPPLLLFAAAFLLSAATRPAAAASADPVVSPGLVMTHVCEQALVKACDAERMKGGLAQCVMCSGMHQYALMFAGCSNHDISKFCSNQTAAAPTAKIPGLGTVQGIVSPISKTVSNFMGIPYAEAPTGKQRWQPPVPKAAWQPSTLQATAYGDQCIQPGKTDNGFSENCLYLNVYSPRDAVGALNNLPVMVWIHGGAYVTGSSDGYLGDAIVAESVNSVVVVTINYRLNIFGFLGSKEISATTNGAGAGNFGIQDQRAALTWVSKVSPPPPRWRRSICKNQYQARQLLTFSSRCISHTVSRFVLDNSFPTRISGRSGATPR
jgi:hypothetical protein